MLPKQNWEKSGALVELILNGEYFSGEPKLSLIPKVEPLTGIKKLFLRLSTYDDELLSTLKISSSAITKTPPISSIKSSFKATIRQLSLSLFFTIVVAPNKQFSNVKFLCKVYHKCFKLHVSVKFFLSRCFVNGP